MNDTPAVKVLVTAYFEPTVSGSRTPSDLFKYPLYRRPEQALLTREAIDLRGALDGQGLELVWLESELDRYLIHIQGSAKINLHDGGSIRVKYQFDNQQAYQSIRPVVAALAGVSAEELNWNSMRSYMTEHPALVNSILAANPRYIFFELSEHGPTGAFGDLLEPWVSIAADPAIVAPGTRCELSLTTPIGPQAYRGGTVHMHDIGNAIRGERVDLFLGTGREVEALAGSVHQFGYLTAAF